VTLGYYRTSYRNIYVADNLQVRPGDFSPYCITAPVDSRLPGGGGNQVCGLYDVSRAKFGQVQNLVTLAPDRTNVFNGVDGLINARFGRGIVVSGGLSTGATTTDNCATPNVPDQFCKQTNGWGGQTAFKMYGVYPLPWGGVQASATYQNLPGAPRSASYAASNAEVVPSLGRNLSACPSATGPCNATATVQLVEPFTMFEPRGNQLDLRFSKIFNWGRTRLQGNFDVYNVTNAGDVLTLTNTFGPRWLRPNTTIAGRLVKFGAQLNF
jgi:hypothetical protein